MSDGNQSVPEFEVEISPLVYWGSRILLTIWVVASFLLGAFGVNWPVGWGMIVLGTILYQGFNGIPQPFEFEATLRIMFYSLVGIFLVFYAFFILGRCIYWIAA